MLLIDDRKTKPANSHTFLDQRVSAEDDRQSAGRQRTQNRCTSGALNVARQQCAGYAEFSTEVLKARVMLLGQEPGRRHHRDLVACVDSPQSGPKSDQGLPAADIA